MAEKYSVAIDGPSGAGKSTLAKAAAAALGICYVDTGAIYRTIGRGVPPGDQPVGRRSRGGGAAGYAAGNAL